MPMELVFVIGMAVLLILCIKVKANAFISLLATALVMGMLSGMSGADTVSAITSGFSGTVKSIGIVIIFGIMLGNYLDAAKGTNRMAYDAVKLVARSVQAWQWPSPAISFPSPSFRTRPSSS